MTNSGASLCSPGTSTTRLAVEKHSPRSLKASQVKVPPSSGKISVMLRLYTLPAVLYSKSLLGLISFSLWSQTTSNLSAAPMVQLRVTGSPSLTVADWMCLMILGGQGPEAPLVPLTPFLLSMGRIVTLEEVSTLPLVLVALQVYLPPSSGNTSLMVTEAVPFLYLTSMISLEVMGLPSFIHETWGSGSPLTWTLSSSLDPSLMERSGLSPVRNDGGHIRESSGSRASSLVWPRDLAPPTELVESDLEKRNNCQ